MRFQENVAPFFADFGEKAEFGARRTLGNLDVADGVEEAEGARVQTRAWTFTYPAGELGAVPVDAVVVIAGRRFRVLENDLGDARIDVLALTKLADR